MNYRVIKPIVGGLMLGALLFFFPFFIVKIFGFLLIFGLFFWLFKGRRSHWRKFAMVHPDKIRSMTDQDYEEFKTTFDKSHCGHRFNKYQDISDQPNK